MDVAIRNAAEHAQNSIHVIMVGCMLLSFCPMLVAGIFLGVLVVIGQASKPGAASVATAVVLLADVAFKIGATVVTEIADYLLHLRVQRVAAQRLAMSSMPSTNVVSTPPAAAVPISMRT